MAVTVTDRRTILDEAESTTNWTGAGYGTTTVVAEYQYAVAASLATTSGQVYYTMPTGSINLSSTCVYVYSFNNALQDAWDASPPPNALLIGDGTNTIAFDMAGANKRVFNHLDGPTEWQCLVLDGAQASAMDSAGNSYVVAGSFASLDLTQITQVGCSFDTNSKALGGGYNVAVDIIRYGNDGIRITGGTTGDRGDFSEIAVEDRNNTTNQKGHGALRELQPVAFGVQAPLTFGDSTSSSDTFFDTAGATIVFEDRNISDGVYYFDVQGSATATTNLFALDACTITTAGPTVSADFAATSGNLNTLTLNACSFIDLGNTVDFSSNADASGHSVTGCTFDGCGVIDVGDVDFTNCVVTNSTSTTDAVTVDLGDMTGTSISGHEGTTSNPSALSFDNNADPDGELDNMSFTKGTASTHAIKFGDTVPSTMTLRGISFSGYNASDSQNDSTLYFADTTGTITVNLIGCSGNISYKSAGATIVLVNNPVSLTVNVSDIATGEALQNARVLVETAPISRQYDGFENGLGNWVEGTGNPESYEVLDVSTDWAHKGNFSLEVQNLSAADGTYSTNSGNSVATRFPVTVGETYRNTVTIRTASDHTETANITVRILWYNGASFLSGTTVDTISSPSASTTYGAQGEATAPASADNALFQVQEVVSGSPNNIHYYIDEVFFEEIANTGWPYNLEPTSITRSTDTATVTLNSHGLSTDDWVTIKGATADEYNGVYQITKTGDNTFTYTSSELSAGAPATPATGYPITVTLAIIQGKTDASGQISATRAYSPDDQPIAGRVRYIKEVQP